MEFGIIPPVRTGATADPDWMTAFARHVESAGFESHRAGGARRGDLRLHQHLPVRGVGPDAAARRLPDPRPARPDGLPGRGHRPDHPGHRRPGRPEPPAGGPGQAHRHRRRPVRGTGPDVPRRRLDGGGAAGHRAPTPGPRGRRMDETIEAMRALWADSGPEGASFDGEFVSFAHAHSFPKPVRPGGVPLHIGGHSEAAARRAGRLGDGFQPLGLGPDELALRVGPDARGRRSRPDATRMPSSCRCRGTSRPRPRRRWRPPRPPASPDAAVDVDEPGPRRPGRRGVRLRRAVRTALLTGPGPCHAVDTDALRRAVPRVRGGRRHPRRDGVRRTVHPGRRAVGAPSRRRRHPDRSVGPGGTSSSGSPPAWPATTPPTTPCSAPTSRSTGRRPPVRSSASPTT